MAYLYLVGDILWWESDSIF